MTQFVHLSDAKRIALIRRSGIRANEAALGEVRGFFCTPVVRDVFRTHQWLRELKRRGVKTIRAVQFYLSPEELVLVGRYSAEHILVPASEAAAIFEKHHDALGLQVVVRSAVPAASIRRLYTPSQVLGWRFHPEAKGKRPFCGCKYCNRGEINAYRVITEA
jgi:hypothetical protein